MARLPARLVVNADDCGYLPAVTRGIGAAIDAGVVTATGVLTNLPGFEAASAMLRAARDVDCGVHLNLTWGEPVTAALAAALPAGRFPSLVKLAATVCSGRLPLRLIAAEWQAQLARARDAGLPIAFLNSHQHVHVLPPLDRLLVDLAVREKIRWVRRLDPDGRAASPAAWGRRVVLATLGIGAARRAAALGPQLPCRGLAASGRLDVDDLLALVATLHPGSRTELMCHPGYDDPQAPAPLRRYHAWERELEALRSEAFRHACRRHEVVLTRFSALEA